MEKLFYKLINNVINAKTIQNLTKRIDVKLVNNEKDYLNYISKPSHILHKILNNNCRDT